MAFEIVYVGFCGGGQEQKPAQVAMTAIEAQPA